MHFLFVRPNPLALKFFILNFERLDKLHVVNFYFLRDQVRLLEPCLVIVVYVTVDGTELSSRESNLSSQLYTLVWP